MPHATLHAASTLEQLFAWTDTTTQFLRSV
jgi:hypothetical protein